MNLKKVWAVDAASTLMMIIVLVVIEAPWWAWLLIFVGVVCQKYTSAQYEKQYAANKLKRKLAGG